MSNKKVNTTELQENNEQSQLNECHNLKTMYKEGLSGQVGMFPNRFVNQGYE